MCLVRSLCWDIRYLLGSNNCHLDLCEYIECIKPRILTFERIDVPRREGCRVLFLMI